MKKVFSFGKIDFFGRGRKINAVTVEIEYKTDARGNMVFTACGDVWNVSRTDIVCGGQCLDAIAKHVKDPVFCEILRLWHLYHLNDMHPECVHQAAAGWVERAAEMVTVPGYLGKTTQKRLGWLTEKEHPEGLLGRACPVCGYKYGTAWKYFPIPDEDEKIILDLLRDAA